MYSTKPPISSPPCSTKATHLPYLTISSFNLTDICGGNNNFGTFCGSIDSSENNNTEQNIINNNNNNHKKNINSKFLDVDVSEAAAKAHHGSFNRSIYEYINDLENFSSPKTLGKPLLEIPEKITPQNLSRQQEITKNGKARHAMLDFFKRRREMELHSTLMFTQ